MEKSKLGLSVPLMAAIVYLIALFGGYIPVLLVLGYVLLCEENAWLKKTSLKALFILLIFSGLSYVLGLVPDMFNLLTSLLDIFKVHFYPSFIHNIFNFLTLIVSFIRPLLLILMAIFAYNNKSLPIPGLDPILDKAFE